MSFQYLAQDKNGGGDVGGMTGRTGVDRKGEAVLLVPTEKILPGCIVGDCLNPVSNMCLYILLLYI